jgi:hypothetical protein
MYGPLGNINHCSKLCKGNVCLDPRLLAPLFFSSDSSGVERRLLFSLHILKFTETYMFEYFIYVLKSLIFIFSDLKSLFCEFMTENLPYNRDVLWVAIPTTTYFSVR